MNQSNAQELVNWLCEQTGTIQFGEISIAAKVHAGRITLIEKHVKETEQPEPRTAGDYGSADQ